MQIQRHHQKIQIRRQLYIQIHKQIHKNTNLQATGISALIARCHFLPSDDDNANTNTPPKNTNTQAAIHINTHANAFKNTDLQATGISALIAQCDFLTSDDDNANNANMDTNTNANTNTNKNANTNAYESANTNTRLDISAPIIIR